jgi:hypothetical protein
MPSFEKPPALAVGSVTSYVVGLEIAHDLGHGWRVACLTALGRRLGLPGALFAEKADAEAYAGACGVAIRARLAELDRLYDD